MPYYPPAAGLPAGGNVNQVLVGTPAWTGTPSIAGLSVGGGAQDACSVKLNDATATVVGYAVQNSNVGGFSGLQYYDQSNTLSVFQGFGNTTHEMRMNNIASSGTFNLLINSVSKLQVTADGLIAPQRLQAAKGANVASVNNLVLGNDGNLFHITGVTQINLISTTGWQAGSMITLIFNGILTVKHGQVASGANKPILLVNSLDLVTAADTRLVLQYDGTSWYDLAQANA